MDKAKEIERQYDKIYRYCYFKLRNREAAEDITQETFLRFLENETYQNEGKALQYFYTVARNLCIDEYRKRAQNKENTIVNIDMDIGISMDLSINQKGMVARSGAGFSEEQLVNSIALRKVLEELEERLDPGERVRFRDLIAQLGKDNIVLLSTHIVSDIEHIADEVLIMKSGQLIYQGKWEEENGDLEQFYLQQFREGKSHA